MACTHAAFRFLALCLCLSVLLAGTAAAAKYKPGDTMTRTDYESVSDALDDVLKAGGILEGRRCAIGVANLGPGALTAAGWYIDSGEIDSSAPYTIANRQTGLSLFHKKSFAPAGTKGLLSYDIADTDYKVVIHWDNPWNEITRDVKYTFKVYNKAVRTDKDLYNQMTKYGDIHKSTGWLEKEEYGIKVMATITDNSFAKLYVSVDASNYNVEGTPVLHTACDRNPRWVGKHCWQECRPTGYCWVGIRCNNDDDCVGPLECSGACKKT